MLYNIWNAIFISNFWLIMNLLNSLRIITVQSLKCKRSILTSSSVEFAHQFQTAASLFNKEEILANLREKLCCTEFIAKRIYNKFPSLRSLSAINDDSLKMLRDKVSAQSIVENPSLLTMDVGKDKYFCLCPRQITNIILIGTFQTLWSERWIYCTQWNRRKLMTLCHYWHWMRVIWIIWWDECSRKKMILSKGIAFIIWAKYLRWLLNGAKCNIFDMS